MSFERNAASHEHSLMDIFGPDASDEAKAITERAAQLSMNDMANVLNAKKSSQDDLTVDIKDHLQDTLWEALEFKASQEITEGRVRRLYIGSSVMNPSIAASFIRKMAAQDLSTSRKPLDDYCAFLSKQYDKLLDNGVDLDSVTISLKYKNPVTRKMAIETYVSEHSKRMELMHSRNHPNVSGRRGRKSYVKP